MMEAQGRHDTFVTSANNLKKDEKRELKKFKKEQNQRRNNMSKQQDNSTYNESAAGMSNMPTQIQSKVSSMTGSKYQIEGATGKNYGSSHKKGQKSAGTAQQLQPPTIQAFDQKAQDYYQKYPTSHEILYQDQMAAEMMMADQQIRGSYIEDSRVKSNSSKHHQTLSLKKGTTDKSKYTNSGKKQNSK